MPFRKSSIFSNSRVGLLTEYAISIDLEQQPQERRALTSSVVNFMINSLGALAIPAVVKRGSVCADNTG